MVDTHKQASSMKKGASAQPVRFLPGAPPVDSFRPWWRRNQQGVIGCPPFSPMSVAPLRGSTFPGQRRMGQESELNLPPSSLQDRAYSQELDSDFYGTNFEIYRVSKRTKRKGGEGGSEWCGGLQLSVRQSNWIQKNIFHANGSAGKFGPETVIYLASRVCDTLLPATQP